MELPGGRDSRFNLGYSMNLLSGETPPEIYGNPNLGRPSTSLQQLSPRHTMVSSACGGRGHNKSDVCYDERGMSSQGISLDSCGVNDMSEDPYNSMQSKKSPPSNGKKTKGRVKIKMEYIENKLRRYTTFSKRKTGIMKKAYELSTLTGTQVMLLVASETGHVYTFATRKLQPMITSEAGKALIQTCLNSPDPPVGSAGGEQRMSATGFEETELTYNISDEDSKDEEGGSASSSEDDDMELPEEPPEKVIVLPDQPLFPDKNKKTGNNAASQPNVTLNADVTSSDKDTTNETNQVDPGTLGLHVEHVTVHQTENISEQPQPSHSLNIQKSDTPLQTVVANPKTTGSSSNAVSSTTNFNSVTLLQPQIKALPLLVQTPTGVGYATLPDGNILGMLQGVQNTSQPQLISIPISSLLSSAVVANPNASVSNNKSGNSNSN